MGRSLGLEQALYLDRPDC